MTNVQLIEEVFKGLGPRQVTSIHLNAAGAKIVVDTEGKHRGLHLWVNDEEKQQAYEKDFSWGIEIMPLDVGHFKTRPKEIQALPATITVRAWRVKTLTDGLLGEILQALQKDGRFRDHIKWAVPGQH